jgi:hypothetical protein
VSTGPSKEELPNRWIEFLRNPVLTVLGWAIYATIYLCSWLALTFRQFLLNSTSHQSSPKRTKGTRPLKNWDNVEEGYERGTKWGIKKAIQYNDAAWLTDIISYYVCKGILLGFFLLLLTQLRVSPITTLLAMSFIAVAFVWTTNRITPKNSKIIGGLCILGGMAGSLSAIFVDKNVPKHHWTWVIFLITGGCWMIKEGLNRREH